MKLEGIGCTEVVTRSRKEEPGQVPAVRQAVRTQYATNMRAQKAKKRRLRPYINNRISASTHQSIDDEPELKLNQSENISQVITNLALSANSKHQIMEIIRSD